MPKLNEIYVCKLCGNITEVVGNGTGEMVCCDEPMQLQQAQTADSTVEKHVPILGAKDGGSLVTVGSVPHPMDEEHHICWIEIVNGDYVNRKYLKPGEAPEAAFWVKAMPGMVLREYCNVHGLWENKI